MEDSKTLSMLNPGKIIELAHVARPATLGAPMASNFPKLVDEFFDTLRRREVPFVVVGGIALLQHVSGRNTDDIDVIMCSSDTGKILELKIDEQNEMFAYGHFGDLRVVVLLAEHPLFSLVAEQYSAPVGYAVGELPTATVEGLLLLKLFALPSLYRQFALDQVAVYEADIFQLLFRSTEDDAFFLDTLAPHLPASDCAEVRRILEESREKVRRMTPDS